MADDAPAETSPTTSTRRSTRASKTPERLTVGHEEPKPASSSRKKKSPAAKPETEDKAEDADASAAAASTDDAGETVSPSKQRSPAKKSSPAKKAKAQEAAAAETAPSAEESAPALTLAGRCACKAVTWTATGAPKLACFCHCSICRRVSGAAFVAQACFGADAVKVEGQLTEYTPENSKLVRKYCANCGSFVLCDMLNAYGVLGVTLGLCDTVPAGYAPTFHGFYGSRVVDFDDSLTKYKEWTDSEKIESGKN